MKPILGFLGIVLVVYLLVLAYNAAPEAAAPATPTAKTAAERDCDRLADKILAHQKLDAFEESWMKYCPGGGQ